MDEVRLELVEIDALVGQLGENAGYLEIELQRGVTYRLTDLQTLATQHGILQLLWA